MSIDADRAVDASALSLSRKPGAARHSLLDAHLLLEAHDGALVPVVEPPRPAARCTHDRCRPVLVDGPLPGGRPAPVTAVVSDVGGHTHVAVTLADDPDADLHEWYGRYCYLAPDEFEPATGRGDRT
jgi:hypothetical protein